MTGRVIRKPSLSDRAAGVLLHLTSLPGPLAAGDLGPGAYRFADDLHRAAMRWWQMLPVTPPGPAPGFSPYSPDSAFAGSPWLISPQILYREGLLSKREIDRARVPSKNRADFSRDHPTRVSLLRQAFGRSARKSKLAEFVERNSDWLDDYCLYAALKESRKSKSWLDWPRDLRRRDPAALAAARERLADSIAFHRFVQWQFDRQWNALKSYCNRLGIGLIGDIPIFVAHESADVWSRRELFLLDSNCRPSAVSGYPPDRFSRRGQIWRHPLYRWPAHRRENFAWWIARFARILQQFDAVRIDHFLGFHRLWAVPAGAKSAAGGRWISTPGLELFAALRRRLGQIPIIAEDLGLQTPGSIALREKLGFPGMRVIQFEFASRGRVKPFAQNSVAYTGTHDNQTLIEWLKDMQASPNGEMRRAIGFIGAGRYPSHWDFIRALLESPANTVILPMQDLLGLGPADRMNTPGTGRGNWTWRMTSPIPDAIIRRIHDLCDRTDRISRSKKISGAK